jgi:hypothetical protein
MFFAGLAALRENKNQYFERKIWWISEQSYLRRPFNKNGSSLRHKGLVKKK